MYDSLHEQEMLLNESLIFMRLYISFHSNLRNPLKKKGTGQISHFQLRESAMDSSASEEG